MTSRFELWLSSHLVDNCAVMEVLFEDNVEPSLAYFLLNFSQLTTYVRI